MEHSTLQEFMSYPFLNLSTLFPAVFKYTTATGEKKQLADLFFFLPPFQLSPIPIPPPKKKSISFPHADIPNATSRKK